MAAGCFFPEDGMKYDRNIAKIEEHGTRHRVDLEVTTVISVGRDVKGYLGIARVGMDMQRTIAAKFTFFSCIVQS